MTQDETEKSDNVKVSKASGDKRSRQRRGRVLKVVIRRLPPSLCEEELLEQMSPLPEHDSYYFVPAENSMSGNSFCRAYFAFRDHQEVVNFRDKWDGYVFLDERGQDYPAIVEFAPFQKMPRKKPKKPDNKSGTIEQGEFYIIKACLTSAYDGPFARKAFGAHVHHGSTIRIYAASAELHDPEYLKFVETMDTEKEVELPSLEATVEELERRDRELRANNGVPNVVTPLIEFVLAKKMEKVRMREERREEKKRKEAERKRAKEEKRRSRREQTARTARENTIREGSDEDAMSIEDEFHRVTNFRQRFEDVHVSTRGGDRERSNRERTMGGAAGGDRGIERSGDGNRERVAKRERNRRGNKENKKGLGGRTNTSNANYHPSDSNNNRGANDDDELSGPSPIPGRQPGHRDKAERDREYRDSSDRHAKYYDDQREPKPTNQRNNSRVYDGEGDQQTDEPKASRRDRKCRDRDRPREKGKNGTSGGNADNGNRTENKRNRGTTEREDRRDQQQPRDDERRPNDDKLDRLEGRKQHSDRDERGAEYRQDRDSLRGDLGAPVGEKEDRPGGGVRREEYRDREDRRDRADRNERLDRRDKADNGLKKGNNQRERRESNRRKDADNESEYRDGGGGAKARSPKIPAAGGRSGNTGDRRGEERGSSTAAKKDQPKPASKRYSDTRPAPLGKSRVVGREAEDGTSDDGPARGRSTSFDEGSGEAHGGEYSRNMEPHEMRPIPRPQQKESAESGVKKLRNKFRPAMEIYKPGSARKRQDLEREVKSSSPDIQP
ncbi:hypothetical protein BIW11_10172 [Tropilaelaps mercedesae]|uniref:UPF3 domain-containing protein n=1 Tax=Tropilaelaps mercedesae TaxID=418985 RepID=A0A1V9XGW1_9ACAR|nr:hypothetical protein BIW11_10172 [Tropilaelaps mercedesae]